ncbi:MAG: GGDEF domain-containing protein [Candidatus Levyibacteriota bacterium]
MDESGKTEVPSEKGLNFSKVRKDYEGLRPVVKKAEAIVVKESPRTKRFVRRAAFGAAREKLHEVHEARKRAENAESKLGIDPLTGVLNKEKFYEELEQAIRTHIRLEKPFSVLMLDLDNFSDVNNRYGHPVGDIAIKEIANLLNLEVREIDVVARFGGDEFAVIAPGTADKHALMTAERLRKAIKDKFLERVSGHMPERELPFSASVGLTSFHPNAKGKTKESVKELAQDLVRKADIALYNSKRDKYGNDLKDRTVSYEKGMIIPKMTKVHTKIDT